MTAAATRVAVPVALDASAFVGVDPAHRVATLCGVTMGTRWQVRLAAASGLAITPQQAAIEARLAEISAQMSHWSEDSSLMRFNRAPAGTWHALPDDFATVMAAAVTVAERSGGAFDPAIGRLTDLWWFGANARPTPPRTVEIAAALRASGWKRIAFDDGARRLRQPGGLWLDLSGIAKGYAADAVANLLCSSGFRHVLVEIGGECVGRGLRPDGDPWWVELETPPGIALPSLRVALHQLAVATSGTYVRGGHTLDPATGRSIPGATRAVSVIHSSAMIADAWATALGVPPVAEAIATAEREGLAVRLVAEDGAEHLSGALIGML